MKHHINFFFLVISCFALNAQTNFSGFIPNNYAVFETFKGDLNNDSLEDVVLLIKEVNQKNVLVNRFDKKVDRNRRGLIVLLKTKKGYDVSSKNLTCFSSENEDGGNYFPPYLGIEIKFGVLNISYLHGRYGNWNYAFKFIDSKFKLIEYYNSSNIGPIVREITTINFLTKKKLVATNINAYGEANENEIFENNWSIITDEALLQLNKIKDFDTLEINQL